MSRTIPFSLVLHFLGLFGLVGFAVNEAAASPKALQWARTGTIPSTSYIKDNRSFMETRDFNGMTVTGKWNDNGIIRNGLHSWVFTGTKTISRESLDGFVKDLVNANFVKFTDNYVEIDCSNLSSTINWFGNSTYWNNILNSIEGVAQAAADAGLKGILMDCESYRSQRSFHFTHLESKYPGNTSGSSNQRRDQWAEQVRLRGKQIIQRMIMGYGSDIRLMFRPGLQFVRQVEEINRKRLLSTVGASEYELIPAFINGLLEGLSGSANIVEFSPAEFNFKKGIASQDSFDRIWNLLKPVDGQVVTNPDYIHPNNVSIYNAKYKIGFMLWLDDSDTSKFSYYDGTDWTNDSSKLDNNTWSPSDLVSWLKRCKDPKYSAVYCTIWSGNYTSGVPNWWKSGGINQDYVDTLNNQF